MCLEVHGLLRLEPGTALCSEQLCGQWTSGWLTMLALGASSPSPHPWCMQTFRHPSPSQAISSLRADVWFKISQSSVGRDVNMRGGILISLALKKFFFNEGQLIFNVVFISFPAFLKAFVPRIGKKYIRVESRSAEKDKALSLGRDTLALGSC